MTAPDERIAALRALLDAANELNHADADGDTIDSAIVDLLPAALRAVEELEGRVIVEEFDSEMLRNARATAYARCAEIVRSVVSDSYLHATEEAARRLGHYGGLMVSRIEAEAKEVTR